jgi:hypothetical protein
MIFIVEPKAKTRDTNTKHYYKISLEVTFEGWVSLHIITERSCGGAAKTRK